MKEVTKQKLWVVICCFSCELVAVRYQLVLSSSEFSGGRVTGPLLNFHSVGAAALILAALLTPLVRRAAAAIVLAGSLLCLPLYLLFVAPGPFRRIVGGEWKTPLLSNYVWDGWALMGLITIALAAFVSLQVFLARSSS